MHDADEIVIDADARSLDVSISPEELRQRRDAWTAPKLKYEKGTLYKYAK